MWGPGDYSRGWLACGPQSPPARTGVGAANGMGVGGRLQALPHQSPLGHSQGQSPQLALSTRFTQSGRGQGVCGAVAGASKVLRGR